jgi:hypothetical protein
MDLSVELDVNTYYVSLNEYGDKYISFILSPNELSNYVFNCVHIKVFNDYELADSYCSTSTKMINYFSSNIISLSSQLNSIQEQFKQNINNLN